MNGKISGLAALVLSIVLMGIPSSEAAPFLMSFTAFKSTSLTMPDYESQQHVLMLQVRGGGQGASTPVAGAAVLSPPSGHTLNETDTITSDILTDESSSTVSSVPYNFSLFQKGDGSETDPDGIPGRFLRMQKGNREKAKAALQHTLEWRKENDVDTILSKPQQKFDICKRILPHYFSGRDPTGHVIFVQRPGKISVELGHANNVTTDDLLMHYVFILEYCWNEVEPRPDQTMTVSLLLVARTSFMRHW